MRISSTGLRPATGAAVLAVVALWAATALAAEAAGTSDRSVAEQIFDAMVQDPGTRPGHRVAHAKGIVCEGTFVPSADAAKLSKAAHFQLGSGDDSVFRWSGQPDHRGQLAGRRSARNGDSVQARGRWIDRHRRAIAQRFRRRNG